MQLRHVMSPNAECSHLPSSMECSLLSHNDCEEYFISLDDVTSVLQGQQQPPLQQLPQQQPQQQHQYQQQQQPFIQNEINVPQQIQIQNQPHQQQLQQQQKLQHQHQIPRQEQQQQQHNLQNTPRGINTQKSTPFQQHHYHQQPQSQHHLNNSHQLIMPNSTLPCFPNEADSPTSVSVVDVIQQDLFKAEPNSFPNEDAYFDHASIYPSFIEL